MCIYIFMSYFTCELFVCVCVCVFFFFFWFFVFLSFVVVFFFNLGGGGARVGCFSQFIWDCKSIVPIFATGALVLALPTSTGILIPLLNYQNVCSILEWIYIYISVLWGFREKLLTQKSAFKGESVGFTIASAECTAYLIRIIRQNRNI